MLLEIKYHKDHKFKVKDDILTEDFKYRVRKLNIKEIEDEYLDELKELEILRDIRIFLRELKIFKLMNRTFNELKYQGKVLYQNIIDNGIFIGYNTGQNITTGNYNICIGYEAGNQITTGSNGICIGYQAGYGYTVPSSTTTYISNHTNYNTSGWVTSTTSGYSTITTP